VGNTATRVSSRNATAQHTVAMDRKMDPSKEEQFFFSGPGVVERLQKQINKPVQHQKIVALPHFRFREPSVVSEYIDAPIDEHEVKDVKKALKDGLRLKLGADDSTTVSNMTESSVGTSASNSRTSSSPGRILSARSLSGRARSSAVAKARTLLANSQENSRRNSKANDSARDSSAVNTARSAGTAELLSAPFSNLSLTHRNSMGKDGDDSAPTSARQSLYPAMEMPQPALDNEEDPQLSGSVEGREAEDENKKRVDTPSKEEKRVDEWDVVPESMQESYRERAPPIKERYFGAGARVMFYDRLRFLNKQRTLTCTDFDERLEKVLFDNEDLDQENQDYPFAEDKEVWLKRQEEGEVGKEEEEEEEEKEKDGRGDRDLKKGTPLRAPAVKVEAADGLKMFENKYAKDFPDPHQSIHMPLSPRSRFISGCIKERKNPRASLILRKRLGKDINISHMAIGNEVAMLLAQCLGDMPNIESLNINNNNLTDEGVAAILNAIAPIKTLKSLNISRNKMDDDAADALADYVKMEDCPCETLVMQVSDVDDFEGERFVRCLMENTSITEIDLSDNLIGRAENMRTVIPDMVTCSEAFAEMLQAEGCILKKLTLAWNTIRLSSSISLTQSLRNNSSLIYLDLSYNSLSFDGGEALGDALLENMTLQFLNVSSNNLNASAIFTISTGIIENKALTRVVLDNNPIGEAGASALMQVPMTVGARCSLSAEKCNVGLTDAKCWFSHSNPLGRHELDLSQPYQRAVAFALLELIANHSTYIFVSAEYEAVKGGAKQDLRLFQTIIKDAKEKFFDERQKSIVAGLRKMRDASGNREKGIQLFHEADEDGGGSIDHDELTDLLTSVGMDVTPDMIEDILDQYDIDGQGAIGMPEFLAFLKSQYKEATTRLEEMTEERIMASPANPNRKYQPPRTGKLIFYVMDGFTRKAKYSVMSSSDQEYAKSVSSEVAAMLGFAVANSKVRLGEAMQMFNTMYGEGGQKATILAELVVKLADPQDCKKLVMKVTRGDKTQLNLLKNAMGGAYKPYLGILNGYYQLDLSKQMDQIALTRLLEQSQTDNTRRQGMSPLTPGQIGDTSQCGNWTSFRNEFYNNKRFAVQPDRFRPMPKSGKLHFDYSNISRPVISEDLIILSDKRLVKILQNIYLITEDQAPAYLKKMNFWRVHLKIASTGKGHMLPQYEYSKEKGINIGKACNEFYMRLDDRMKLYSNGFKRENVTVDYQGGKSKDKKDKGKGKDKDKNKDKNSAENTEEKVEKEKPESAKASHAANRRQSESKLADGERNEEGAGDGTARVGPDADPKEAGGDAADDEPAEPEDKIVEGSKAHMKLKMNEEMAKYKLLIESPLVSKEAKSARINEQLEDIMSNAWILCRHVAAIIVATPHGTSARTDWFGSYHVDLIVSLFSRIVDIHNFEVIMSTLTAEECAGVYCRIGWLNIFNPTKPEGMYCLDFCRYEERLVAKMMIGLALVEPGDNWKDSCFRWGWDVDEVPGWELTTGYTLDESCTVKGVVQVRYYSGEGKGKAGCVAHGRFRKSMMALVLPNEDVAAIDFDEMFPYLVHGSGDSDSDEDEDAKRGRADLAKSLADSAKENDDNNNAEEEAEEVIEGEKPLRPGELYLKRNPKMFNELFAPPGGCQKQKNPLSLIYTTQIVKDEPVT